MEDNVQELYSLLRQADVKAQAGDEQAKVDAKKIYDHIQHIETQSKKQASEEYPPVVAGAVGEGLAVTGKVAQMANQFRKIPQAVEDIAINQKAHNEVLADLIKKNEMMQNRGVSTPNADINWTKSMTGISPEGSTMSKESLNTAGRMKSAIQAGGPMAGGSISPSGNVILPPDLKAERQVAMELRNAQIAEQLKQSSLLGKLSKGAGIIGELGGRALTKANPYLQAFSVPYEVTDAYNKFHRDDNVGGTLSTIGALSGLASLYPPLTVPAGVLSLGTHGADWAWQNFLERRNKPQQGYEQQPAQYANGGLVYLNDGGQPDPIPIQKNNPMVEKEAQKVLTEIAKRKALYEISQIAQQERAKQAASRMRTSSVSPSVFPANLEPSGNGGPMLNNPLNR